MCQTGATVYTVTLKHKTKPKVRAVRLKHGDVVWSKEGATSLALSHANAKEDDWELKTVTKSFDARWMS
jgi:hypothetical protein